VRALAALLVALAAGAAGAGDRAIQVGGWIGHYDPATVPLWPQRLQLLKGGAESEGRLIEDAQRRARDAGNPARFVFYLSLSSLDGGCGCFDADVLGRIRRAHPECVLRDARGEDVSTFLDQLPRGRQIALDVGNRACIDAWTDVVLETARRYGWDGVWADNVVRGRFDETWSAPPVNPRTRAAYAVDEYRRDMLAALRRVHDRLHDAGKLLLANHSGAWRSFEDDAALRDQVLAVDGVEIEDFAYTFSGAPQPEADWLRQLRYLAFANAHGVLTWVEGGHGALMEPDKREYVLASYLLTRAGRSVVGDLNAAKTWWPALATDLGDARGTFTCVDGATRCPAPGRVFARDFARARVLVNPGDAPRRVPVAGTYRGLDGEPIGDAVTLPAHGGRVLVLDDHTASRTSSGRAGR
jgi:putative glycosyl hydrolase-like family 15 (GHL15) protein